MKRILITGGAGFIGSNLAKRLLHDESNTVICFDNFDPFYSISQKELNLEGLKQNKRFKFIEGGIRSMDDLNKAKGIDVIIHLAAKTGVRPSIHEPGVYYDVNVKGTQTLLEFARQKKSSNLSSPLPAMCMALIKMYRGKKIKIFCLLALTLLLNYPAKCWGMYIIICMVFVL